MKLAILLITAGFLILSYKRNKSISDPYVAFNILWVGVSALILIGNDYVYEPSNIALTCVLIGTISFNLSAYTPRLTFGTYTLFSSDDYSVYYKRAFIISVIVLLFSAISAVEAIRSVLAGNSFSVIRDDYFTYTSSGSVYRYYFRNYFLSPFRYVVIITTIIGILKKETISKWLLINTVGIIFLQAITSGGRYVLMNAIFMMICGYSLFGNKEKITAKQKVIIVVVICIFSYVIVFLTNDRASFAMQKMSVGERLYYTIYGYFVGSTTYLGEIVAKTPSLAGMTHGVNFFAGFVSPVFVLLNGLHLIPYPSIFSVIGTYACEVLRIGPSSYYNAMPTIFGYFYIDGGFIFVFLEAWLFGYICKRLYCRGKDGNLLMNAMYILIYIQICNSSTRWFFYSPEYCLAFIYLNFVIRKSNNQ